MKSKWFYAKERGEADDVTAILTLLFIVIVIIASVGALVRGYTRDSTKSELTARVVDVDIKTIGTGNDAKAHYLINVQPVQDVDNVYEPVGDTETIEVADSHMYGQYNSADIYFTLKNNIGAVYHFNLQGWRDGYHSEFRNIYAYTKLQDKGR